MDVFTLKKLAGQANISTTMRYVHMSDARAREAIEKAWRFGVGTKMATHSKTDLNKKLSQRD
jgi:hypothetical protein